MEMIRRIEVLESGIKTSQEVAKIKSQLTEKFAMQGDEQLQIMRRKHETKIRQVEQRNSQDLDEKNFEIKALSIRENTLLAEKKTLETECTKLKSENSVLKTKSNEVILSKSDEIKAKDQAIEDQAESSYH